MAQLTKQALIVENNTSFPNNNTNYITPAILRGFNTDMIDSTVNQTQYNTDSGSWNISIASINAFTASASGLTTGSLLITASAAGNVITFTKGNNTTFNVTVATGSIPDISNLNQATASLQAYTASANVKFSNIESTTASLNTSVSNINTFTASTAISLTNLNASSASQQISINNLNGATGSYATTGSNTFVSANTFTSISASSFVSASAFIGNGGQLTGITASIAIPVASNGVPQGNATTLDFYGNAVGVQVIGGTALININAIGTGSFNAYTASTNSDLAAIHQATASLQQFTSSFSTSSLVSTASFNSYTSSTNNRLNNIETTTASLNTSVSNLNSFTSSQDTKNSTLATYTGSNDTKWNTLGGQSGSWITESETGSFAYINKDNSWSVNQNFTNITAVSASFRYVQTLYETSSVIYSSGSNQLGDATDDIQTLIGQTKVSGSLGVTGSFYNNSLSYPTTDGTAGQFVITNGAGTLAFDDVHVLLEDVRYGENITLGDPLYVSGSNGNRAVVYKANAASGSKMPVIYIASSTAAANTNTTAITLGLITGVTTTGYTPGTTIYVAEGTAGWSASRPSGSASIVQALGIVTKEGAGGSGRGLVLNPGPATLPNLQTGYAWVGNGGNQPTAVLTSSFAGATINTGSFVTTGSATTASQTIFGDFKFDTTYTANAPAVAQAGGTNILYIDYSIFNGAYATEFGYWNGNGYTGVTVNGTGVTNAIVTNTVYGSNLELTLSTGTVTNGATYTFSGPAIQVIDITGSAYANAQMGVKAGSNTCVLTQNGLALSATNYDATNINIGFIQMGAYGYSGNDQFAIAVSSSFYGVQGWDKGPFISNYKNGVGDIANIGFENDSHYTDGRVTILTPLIAQSGSVVTGSLNVSGSNTLIGTKTITGSVFISGSKTIIGPNTITGSLNISGSNTLIGTKTITGSVFISGSKTIIGTNTITGSMITTGSFVLTGSAYGNVVSMSITSNTASMDLSRGNYFELTSSTTPCRINITNLQPGLTSTLIISASASSSILFSTNVAQPSGSAYSGSAGSIDILSLVAFNSSKINVVATKALI